MVPGSALDEILVTHGIRVTSQRRFVLATLRERPGAHVSADEVFEAGKQSLVTLSRPTAYSALAELAACGIAHAVTGRGAAVYGYGRGDDHAHFQCRACGQLLDVQPADRRQSMRLADPAFAVEQTHVLFVGRCSACSTGGG